MFPAIFIAQKHTKYPRIYIRFFLMSFKRLKWKANRSPLKLSPKVRGAIEAEGTVSFNPTLSS